MFLTLPLDRSIKACFELYFDTRFESQRIIQNMPFKRQCLKASIRLQEFQNHAFNQFLVRSKIKYMKYAKVQLLALQKVLEIFTLCINMITSKTEMV